MSYFDHVQCHSCGARMQPEQLNPGRGEMPSCPYCNANLNLADLFGVKDSFVGIGDEEGNNHSLDDLVGGDLYDSRYAGGQAPSSQPPPRQPHPSRAAAPPRPSSPPRHHAAARANAMVRSRSASTEDGDAPSALDILREMKRRK